MAHIGVGINENVILQKVEFVNKEGKYSLDFTFGNEAADATITDNPFEEKLDENGYVITGGGTNIKLWPPMVPDDEDNKGNRRTPQQKYDIVYKELSEQRNLLTQFALCFMGTADLAGKINPYLNTGMTAESMIHLLPNEEMINRVFRNMAEGFTSIMSPKLQEAPVPLRLILVRQSKKKHYASFRKNYIREQPIVELGVIPKESSKIKFSAYEITNGLNNGTPVTSDTADAKPESDLTDAGVFGGDSPTGNVFS